MAKRGRPKKVQEAEVATNVTVMEESKGENEFVEVVEEKAPASVVKAPIGDIKAKISKVKVAPKYDVWMGATKECPFWTVHAGGRDFSQENEIVSYDADTRQTRREKVKGKVVELSKAEISFIAKEVGKKILRKYGSKASIINTDDPRYTFGNNDSPLGQYVFMKVLEKNLPYNWRDNDPETMA
tara:strand:- start:22 stop:573 length:552 start_codon:yes stop_codon:yes gene_type:complete